MALTDTLNRPLRDLRVSVTDRCNFRCTYCMPRDVFGADHAFIRRDDLLTFDEITRIVTVFASRGVRTVRLTGGEPLLRPDLQALVRRLAAVPGVEDLAMTTNGAALAAAAGALAAAGLDRVTVSLDALDPEVFTRLADTAVPLEAVLRGLRAAHVAGLHPIKLNTVVRRGVNESQILPLVRYAREHGFNLRFIEYMDVGHTNGWLPDDVVPAAELLAAVDAVFPVEPLPSERAAETARRYRFRDGGGEVGVIASVTEPFCGRCTRARLSPAGELFTCLFGTRGTDLRALLRGGADDEALARAIDDVWRMRTDRYSEERSYGSPAADRVEMSYIGG